MLLCWNLRGAIGGDEEEEVDDDGGGHETMECVSEEESGKERERERERHVRCKLSCRKRLKARLIHFRRE